MSERPPGRFTERVSSLSRPPTTATTLTYLYENSSLPFSLTGITDENGNRYVTWGYDTEGRATSNYMGGSGLSANSIKSSRNRCTLRPAC